MLTHLKGLPSVCLQTNSRYWILPAVSGWMIRLFTKTIDCLFVPEIIDLTGTILKRNTRPLTPVEIQEAKRVFGDYLPYEQIYIDESSWLAKLGAIFSGTKDMGVCIFHTIHFTRSIQSKIGNRDMAWLIHELVHIAQMEQIGSQYIPEAIYAQYTEGYDYGGGVNLAKKPIACFNREQQGNVFQDYYYFILHDRSHPRWGILPPHSYTTAIEDLKQGKL